jgi:hypothetical protein
LKRLVGTFSLRVGHASSAARLKVELAKWAPTWLRGRVAERCLNTLDFLSHIPSWRYNICISQHNPILAPEKPTGLLKGLRDWPAKIPNFFGARNGPPRTNQCEKRTLWTVFCCRTHF